MHPERDSHDACSSRDAVACIGLIVPSRYSNTRPVSAPTEYSSSVKRLCQTVVEALPATFGRGSEQPGRPRTPRDPKKGGNTLRTGEPVTTAATVPLRALAPVQGATALADRLHPRVGALSPARSAPSTEVRPHLHWPMGSALAMCDSADRAARMRGVAPTNRWTRRRECAGQPCAPARGLRHPTS